MLYIVARDHGLCVKCGRPGEIVHHKEHLTPENINTPEIALGENNLELLCREIATPSPTPPTYPQIAASCSTRRETLSSVSFCHKLYKNKRRRPVQIADTGSTPLRYPHASPGYHKRRRKCGQKAKRRK